MSTTRAVAGSLLVAAAGAALLAIEALVDPARAWFAYLAAWTFGVTVCIGALLLLMTGHAAKAGWMVVTRRPTEAVVDALPLFLLLFVPIAVGLRHLYPWAAPLDTLEPAVRAAVEHKRAYLTVPFFVARSLAYLAVLGVVGGLLRAWSLVNDARPRLVLVLRMRRLSAGALPLLALVVTWASFDWTMSLEPSWRSTIYGLYVCAGAFVAAIALACIMTPLSRSVLRAPVPFSADHAQAVGRMLFAMTCFWAYLAFSQLLIYWIADIPEEVSYYGLRTTGSWSVVTYTLLFGNFVAPFFALLNRHWKRHAGYVGALGAWMLLMHLVDVYWLVMPSHDRAGLAADSWLDAGAILLVGGVASAWIVRRWSSVAPLPRHVPELAEGLTYEAAL